VSSVASVHTGTGSPGWAMTRLAGRCSCSLHMWQFCSSMGLDQMDNGVCVTVAARPSNHTYKSVTKIPHAFHTCKSFKRHIILCRLKINRMTDVHTQMCIFFSGCEHGCEPGGSSMKLMWNPFFCLPRLCGKLLQKVRQHGWALPQGFRDHLLPIQFSTILKTS
jgi:hypothetical protein